MSLRLLRKKKSSTSQKLREEDVVAESSSSKRGSASPSRRAQNNNDDGIDDVNEEQQPLAYRPKEATMTESERRYEVIRQQRMAERVRKEAKKSHKERVSDFNDRLGRQSEHYDLPRVGLFLLACCLQASPAANADGCSPVARRLDLDRLHGMAWHGRVSRRWPLCPRVALVVYTISLLFLVPRQCICVVVGL